MGRLGNTACAKLVLAVIVDEASALLKTSVLRLRRLAVPGNIEWSMSDFMPFAPCLLVHRSIGAAFCRGAQPHDSIHSHHTMAEALRHDEKRIDLCLVNTRSRVAGES